jgi:hypothetical protein
MYFLSSSISFFRAFFSAVVRVVIQIVLYTINV